MSGSELMRSVASSWFKVMVIIAWGCLGSVSAFSQDYSLELWRHKDGLPSSAIYALAQSPDGFLWLGTLDGLAYYDAFQFATIGMNQTQRRPLGQVRALLIARDGALLAGGESGTLLRFHDRVADTQSFSSLISALTALTAGGILITPKMRNFPALKTSKRDQICRFNVFRMLLQEKVHERIYHPPKRIQVNQALPPASSARSSKRFLLESHHMRRHVRSRDPEWRSMDCDQQQWPLRNSRQTRIVKRSLPRMGYRTTEFGICLKTATEVFGSQRKTASIAFMRTDSLPGVLNGYACCRLPIPPAEQRETPANAV